MSPRTFRIELRRPGPTAGGLGGVLPVPPGGYAELARPAVVVRRGQDQYGRPVEVDGTGVLARCLRHETDHLDGIVFGDRLSSRRRRGLYETHRQVAHRYPPTWPAPAASDRL